ncbi:MAG: PilZ domain-containing protein [Tissierella sp.]|nr:PilZ domain-containing protein [Tissierella sp.]
MYISELTFDDFIEIEILREDIENGNEIKINTKVDSIDNEVLKAVIPDNLRRLPDITEIFVYYRTEGKCKRWICKLEGFERSNQLSIIVLSCNSKSEDVNNREAYRVSYGKDIEYEFNEKKMEGRLKDISVTGMGLYTNGKHEFGDKISLVLEDLDYELELEGHVVRDEEQRLGLFKYLYGIKMNEKTEIEREEVMSYIFKKQLEIIRERKRPN